MKLCLIENEAPVNDIEDTNASPDLEENNYNSEVVETIHENEAIMEIDIEDQEEKDTDKIKCGFCDKNFLSKKALEWHVQRHEEEYESEISGNKETEFVQAVEEEKKLQCDSCDTEFSDQNEYNNHRTICDDSLVMEENSDVTSAERSVSERKFQCDSCDTEFLEEKEFTNHKTICDDSLVTEENSDVASAERSIVDRKFQCDSCETEFSNQAEYDNHISICDDSFGIETESFENEDSNHVDYPTNAEVFLDTNSTISQTVCTCSKQSGHPGFHGKTNLFNPYSKSFASFETQFPRNGNCQNCTIKPVYVKEEFEDNSQDPEGVTWYQNVESDNFEGQNLLEPPLELREKIESNLKRRVSLKSHERTFKGTKLYRCKTCLKSFSDKSTLKRHIRIGHSNNHSL